MKSILLKVILAVVGVVISVNASAYDFEVDGIYYNIVSAGDKTCEVTYKGDEVIYKDQDWRHARTYSGVLTIPETIIYNNQTIAVVKIGNFAFYDNELIEVNLPSTLITIGDYAFSGCSKLKNIILPQSLNFIGEDAFYECVGLTDLFIPKSVLKIESSTFGYCSNLKSINVDSGNTVYDSRENCNAIIETATNTMIAGCALTTIPETVEVLEGYCLADCKFDNLTISNNIKRIGSVALNTEAIKTFVIEDGNSTLTMLGWFSDWNNLQTLYIGRNLRVDEDAEISTFSNSENEVICETITLGPKVTEIPNYLFYGANRIKSVKILGEIKKVGEHAFYGFGRFRPELDFEFPNTDSIIYIGDQSFYNCLFPKGIGIQLPEKVDYLGSGAFYGSACLSEQLNLPKRSIIEWGTFGFSSRVRSMIISEDTKKIHAKAMYSMRDLEEFIIKYGENKLRLNQERYDLNSNQMNFFDCPIKRLFLDRELEFETGGGSHNVNPFLNNITLEELVIGDNLNVLKVEFNGCENLRLIDLGRNIDSLADNNKGTFIGCKNITTIYSRNPVPPTNAIFDQMVYLNAEVKVPKGSLEAYQADTNWRNFWNISEMDFSDVDNVMDDAQAEVDVYNLQGGRMRKGVKRSEATQGLPQGIYIINGEKILVK